jgi:hypothetical protein
MSSSPLVKPCMRFSRTRLSDRLLLKAFTSFSVPSFFYDTLAFVSDFFCFLPLGSQIYLPLESLVSFPRLLPFGSFVDYCHCEHTPLLESVTWSRVPSLLEGYVVLHIYTTTNSSDFSFTWFSFRLRLIVCLSGCYPLWMRPPTFIHLPFVNTPPVPTPTVPYGASCHFFPYSCRFRLIREVDQLW